MVIMLSILIGLLAQLDGQYVLDSPSGRVLDVNIGTNLTPMQSRKDHHLVLVDPLPKVCNTLSDFFATDPNVSFFCMALAIYTGFATFNHYNNNNSGVSSSLAKVSSNTSHERFGSESRHSNVVVMDALLFFQSLISKNVFVDALKLDLQGFELSVLRRIEPILSQMPAKINHIFAECFFPNEGRQIYQTNNSCTAIAKLLQTHGYTTKVISSTKEYGDVEAFKSPATSFTGKDVFSSQDPFFRRVSRKRKRRHRPLLLM